MKILKKSLRILKNLVLGVLAFLVIYVVSAFLLSRITVNADASNASEEVAIYIKTNGVHTDIVVPLKNEIKDWSSEIKVENTQAKDTAAKFIAFGWGDKGFYLDTPEWSDLKVSTAFNAVFCLSSSTIHTTFYSGIKESKDCVKISISKENYQKIIDYVDGSFQLDDDGNPMFIPARTYGKNDSFYEAKGKYSLFYTCNSWANGALKKANQKAALWTVTDSGIFCHYR